MPLDPVSLIAIAVAVLAIVGVIYYARRNAKLTEILIENQTRLKNGHKAYKELDSSHAQTVEDLAQLRKDYDQMAMNQSEAKYKADQYKKDLDKLTKNTEENTNASRLKLDHLQEENTVLKQQLGDAVREKQDFAQRLKAQATSEVNRQQVEQKSEELAKMRANLSEAVTTAKKLKASNEKIKGILRKVDPKETKKYKQKSSQYEQLYTSMKSLREMAEERNENWETALRKLSMHVLGEGKYTESSPIGELVGEALERIGTRLVEDDQEERGGAVSDVHKQEASPIVMEEPAADSAEFSEEQVTEVPAPISKPAN